MIKKVMCILALCACASFSASASEVSLESGFKQPADAYKPWTWWHWMNGHVTRDSITRDLEEMKRSGLGGFGLWNTHEGIPKGPVKYGSPEWWDLVEHTMDEAERLGLFMEMFNGAGWSATAARRVFNLAVKLQPYGQSHWPSSWILQVVKPSVP